MPICYDARRGGDAMAAEFAGAGGLRLILGAQISFCIFLGRILLACHSQSDSMILARIDGVSICHAAP